MNLARVTLVENSQSFPPVFRALVLAWWIVAVSALAFSLYASGYFFWSLEIAPDIIIESVRARRWAFVLHAGGGEVGLLTGPFQFRAQIAFRRPRLHRVLGIIYLFAASVAGISGIFLAMYSFGGLPAHIGFALLGVASCLAYLRIRQRRILAHRAWIIRSYSVMLGAITFRLWLPVLAGVFSLAFVTVVSDCELSLLGGQSGSRGSLSGCLSTGRVSAFAFVIALQDRQCRLLSTDVPMKSALP